MCDPLGRGGVVVSECIHRPDPLRRRARRRRWWVFDSESGNYGKNIDFTTNGGTVSITTNNTNASLTSAFSMSNLTSNGSGTATIVMDHTGGAGGAVSLLNGLQLTAVPEPTVPAIMAIFGSIALLARRRNLG